MDWFFVILLVGMLVAVGYAKVQHGVVKTTGKPYMMEEDQ